MGADTEVLIVGAGPVGLTLAIDLGRKGVRCTLIGRKEAPQFLPKMERCNARTMEIFRRMGLAGTTRTAGLDRTPPMDVYVILGMNEPPLLRLPYPSVAEAQGQIDACTDGSMPLEPYQLISQYTLEPLLKSVAQALPGVTVRYGCEFLSLEQDATGVTARVRNGAGPVAAVRAAYLVGCDGGASRVRQELGIGLRGEGNLLQLRQALYCCDDLYERIPIGNGPGKGRHYHVADDSATLLIMQDSTRHWTLHAIVGEDQDMARQFERTVGVPVKYDMLYVGEWKQNLLLADHYGKGRVFLAGDSVHLLIPTGGLRNDTELGAAAHLAGRPSAACLARRPRRPAGPPGARLHAASPRCHRGGRVRVATVLRGAWRALRCSRRRRRLGPRCLRLRSHSAAAGPAHRLARQSASDRTQRARRDCDRSPVNEDVDSSIGRDMRRCKRPGRLSESRGSYHRPVYAGNWRRHPRARARPAARRALEERGGGREPRRRHRQYRHRVRRQGGARRLHAALHRHLLRHQSGAGAHAAVRSGEELCSGDPCRHQFGRRHRPSAGAGEIAARVHRPGARP